MLHRWHVRFSCSSRSSARPRPRSTNLVLTADQFDEVEIREVSCFGAVPMKSGIPAAEHTLLRSATAKRISWSFRSICYCGTAMAVTHSYGRASISQIQVPPRSKIGRLTSGWGPRPVIRRCRLSAEGDPQALLADTASASWRVAPMGYSADAAVPMNYPTVGAERQEGFSNNMGHSRKLGKARCEKLAPHWLTEFEMHPRPRRVV
jgi:hypothetical protein